MSMLAAPVFADPPANAPPKAAAAKRDKGAKREARLVKALEKEGIAEAKAKRVLAVIKQSKPAMRQAREQMKSAKQALRADAKDAAAKQKLEAAKQKLQTIRKQTEAELAKFLSAAEQSKVKQVVQRGKRHGKQKAKHKPGRGA